MGPLQSAYHAEAKGPWQNLMVKMLQGECNPAVHGYRPWHTVDVRDTAECQIGLLESSKVKNGDRYLAISTDKIDVEEVCARIDQLLPELGFATPDMTEDLDEEKLKRSQERRAVYAGVELRNDGIRSVVPIVFRDLNDSLRDMAETLIAVAGVTPVLRPGFSLRK